MPAWLITGCSTGLGRHLAEAVLARGYDAIVTARDSVKVQDLVDEYPDTALALALDVADGRSRTWCGRPKNGSAAWTCSSTTPGTGTGPQWRKNPRSRNCLPPLLRPGRDDQGRAAGHAGPPRRRHCQHLLDRGAYLPAGGSATTRLPRPLWRRCRHRCGRSWSHSASR